VALAFGGHPLDVPAPLDRPSLAAVAVPENSQELGAGGDAQARQTLALVLGFVIGFGVGHLIAGDQGNFALFLILDAIVVGVAVVLNAIFIHSGVLYGIAVITLIASHLFQGIDAYSAARPKDVVKQQRDSAIFLVEGPKRNATQVTSVQFSFAF
jgi:hypothetical protein